MVGEEREGLGLLVRELAAAPPVVDALAGVGLVEPQRARHENTAVGRSLVVHRSERTRIRKVTAQAAWCVIF